MGKEKEEERKGKQRVFPEEGPQATNKPVA